MKRDQTLMIIHPKCEIKQYCFIEEFLEGIRNSSLFLTLKVKYLKN